MSDDFIVEGVTKHYDGVTALSEVSTDVEPGTFPDPFGPTRPWKVPGSTSVDTSDSAATPS